MQEEFIRQQPLLKPAKLKKPPKESRFLQLRIPLHDQVRDPPGLDRRRHIGRESIKRPSDVRKDEHRTRPILAGVTSSVSTAAAIESPISGAVTSAAGGRNDYFGPAALLGGEREMEEGGCGDGRGSMDGG